MWLILLSVGCGGTPEPGPGEWDDGPYHCCAEGDGTSCCGGYEQGMCFQNGGVLGRCAQAGEMVEGKDICALCCDGLDWTEPLERTGAMIEGYPDGCEPSTPPSLGVCVACGDGVCGPGENDCVCPDDCG